MARLASGPVVPAATETANASMAREKEISMISAKLICFVYILSSSI
jgi:hypothetical protein